jgi:hypothetical protein
MDMKKQNTIFPLAPIPVTKFSTHDTDSAHVLTSFKTELLSHKGEVKAGKRLAKQTTKRTKKGGKRTAPLPQPSPESGSRPSPKQNRKKNLLQRKFSLLKKEKQKLSTKRKDCIDKIFRWYIEKEPEIGPNLDIYAKTSFDSFIWARAGGLTLPSSFARKTTDHSKNTNLQDWLLLKQLFSQKVMYKFERKYYDQLKANKKLCQYFRLLKIYKILYNRLQVAKGPAALAQAYSLTTHFVDTPLCTKSTKGLLKFYTNSPFPQLHVFLHPVRFRTSFSLVSNCTPFYPAFWLRFPLYGHYITKGTAKQIKEILCFTFFWEKKFFHDLSKKEQAIFYLSLEKKQEKWKRAKARKLRKQIKQIKKRIR